MTGKAAVGAFSNEHDTAQGRSIFIRQPRGRPSEHADDRVEALFEAILADPTAFPDSWFEADQEGQSNEDQRPEGVPTTLASSVSHLERIVGTDRATITIPEAALVLGVSESAARRAAHRGQIPTIRVNRRVLVPAIAFRRLLGEI